MSGSRTASANGDAPRPDLPDLDVIRQIGSGSYGQVWLATNRTTGKLLAVKTIPLDPGDAAGRAGREIASLIRYEANSRGEHEHLLTIHHVGQTESFLYYTMDAADDASGSPASLAADYRPATLESRLGSGPLPPARCLLLANQILAGLACLHEKGLVHRDIKPSNCIFVAAKLKLADFGLVTHGEGAVSRLGTPKYMPPDGKMDARADVYAAGLVIYEMYTGLPADSFPRWSASALAARRDPGLLALNQLALRACQRDPASRYRDAQDMLTALGQLRARARAPKRRSRAALLLAVAFIAVAAIISAVALWPGEPQLVHVNFITVPFEAVVCLDGRRVLDPQGEPYTTPCTIPGLPARRHRVVFRLKGLPDLDVGDNDFGAIREVRGNWREQNEP